MIWHFENTEIYILGSLHVLREDDNTHLNSIEEIYTNVTTIVFESSLDFEHQQVCFYNDDKLSNHISKTLFRDVKKTWLKYGFPYADLEKSKIWQVANSIIFGILESKGLNAQNGIDNLLWEKSKTDKKHIEVLEPPDAALSFFDSAPLEEQVKYLSNTVRNKKQVIEGMNGVIENWKTGNMEELAIILRTTIENLPVMFNGLIAERNSLWMNHFISALNSEVPTLFVIGALHCVDVCSIQNMLRDKHGYTSNIINIKP